MKSSKEGNPFRVIIVGGGIAGLTLANSLERANIDYVLLEARADIAPQVGASIGILPNGCRILDQLNMFETLEPHGVRPDGDCVWVRGKKINETFAGSLLEARFGYRPIFMERETSLSVMYENLDDRSKIHVNARCSVIEHTEQGVIVKCTDGKEYRGDVVVGADGVHSFVRGEMRRYADAKTEELMKQDKKSLSAEYKCLFGISERVDGIEPGDLHRSYDQDLSFMIIGGRNRTYFFVFQKLAKRYFAPNIPKYSKSDADTFANQYIDYIIGGTNGKTKFGEIWEKRRSSNLVPTEESFNEAWTYGRFACIGDSIHKMTPNAGAGGNAGMESAAALANCIYDLVHTSKYGKTDYASVEKALKSFHDVRKSRVKYITQEANDFTRIEALATIKDKFLAYYLMPSAADFLVDSWSSTMVGAVKLDFLPKPKRSIGNNMPFHPKRGWGQGESMLKRALLAFPLLALWWVASSLMGTCQVQMLPFLEAVMTKPWIEDVTGKVPVKELYTGIKGLDSIVRLYVAAFTPSMTGLDHLSTSLRQSSQSINLYAPQRLQAMTFLADITAVNAIWLIESSRRANFFTLTTVPIFFMIYMQYVGIGVVAPIFYFLHYISTPPSKYHTSDNRLVQMSYAKTLVPALIIGYLVPTAATYWPTSQLSTLQSWNYLWQFFPITLIGLHGLFARCVKDTTITDKSKNVTADLSYLRLAYIVSAIVSAGVYWYVYAVSPVPFLDIFFTELDSRRTMKSLTEIMGTMLKLDEVFCFLSSAVWTLLCFRDLKSEKRLKTSWFNVIGTMALSTTLIGPGASFALMWWWREEILARKMDEDDE